MTCYNSSYTVICFLDNEDHNAKLLLSLETKRMHERKDKYNNKKRHQNRTEQSRIEQSRTEQNRIEQTRRKHNAIQCYTRQYENSTLSSVLMIIKRIETIKLQFYS